MLKFTLNIERSERDLHPRVKMKDPELPVLLINRRLTGWPTRFHIFRSQPEPVYLKNKLVKFASRLVSQLLEVSVENP